MNGGMRCHGCGGTGKAAASGFRCPACDGRGVVAEAGGVPYGGAKRGRSRGKAEGRRRRRDGKGG